MKRHIYILLLLLTCSCKVPFQPPVTTATYNYLVVDGIINSSATDSTLIKLSRTFKISTSPVTNPELHAQVSVEDAASITYPFLETGKGNYIAVGLGLNNTKQYRLRIKTSDNKIYLSDFVAVKPTPPIDSIGFTPVNDHLIIYANAHDITNDTRYYRWEYSETYEFNALYDSKYITNGGQILPRTPAQFLKPCFQSDVSADIVLASTKQLVQDVLYQAPIVTIPSTSEKISVEYSILLKQYALTADAYTFWQQTKKNTEQLGSIFDALPSQINGNIHCITDPTLPVFGYVSITNPQTKRVFIYAIDLPRYWVRKYPYQCAIDSFFFNKLNGNNLNVQTGLIPISSPEIPIDTISSGPGTPVLGYKASSPPCIDCSIRGTTIKPPFWQ